MLTCKELTSLVAHDELSGAPRATQLQARLHLLICGHCRRYVRQLRAIARAARATFALDTSSPGRLAELRRRVLGQEVVSKLTPDPPPPA